jgi:hypothetical protein
MLATNAQLTYDNGVIKNWELDVTEGLKKIYKTEGNFRQFLERVFGKEVKEHYLSTKE